MLTLGTIVAALTPYRATGQEPPLAAVHIDSREVVAGGLFVAFPGEVHDGHDFVGDALQRGARAVMVNRPVDGVTLLDLRGGSAVALPADSGPFGFLVDDSTAALQAIAAYYRQQFKVRVIGITGSVGKTTTKELVFEVLAQRFVTLRSESSYNNEIGLPLTLLNLRPEHERVVLEMGTYGRGEIALLCRLARPVVGVLTMIGPVHLERMKTIENIVIAKRELVEALPADGVAILNRDDARVMTMAGHTPARVFTYGLSPEADLWAADIESMGLEGIRFTLHHGDERLSVAVPLLGRHSVHTALRAAAVGLAEGLRWEEIVTGLQSQHAQLRLVTVPGPAGSLLIDDTYNSSPASVFAALNLLLDLTGRRVVVLGDMLELGDLEEESHRLVGRRAAAVADVLVAVGALGRLIGEEALVSGLSARRVFFAADPAQTVDLLRATIAPGDVVLLKASRGLRLDRVISELGQND